MSPAGASLVNALLRAARHYAAQGRQVHLARQEHTAGRTTAHADLLGSVDGRSVALEAKMTKGDYFRLYPERAAQRAELQRLYELGYDVSLVVEFTDYGEVYRVPWAHVRAFLMMAWRRSLSRDWFMVYGQLARQLSEPKRSVFWRDAVDHPDRYDAVKRVTKDRYNKALAKIDGDLDRDAARDRRLTAKQRARQERLESRPAPGTPEHRDYVIKLAQEGAGRALGTAAGKAQRKRRGWAGGGR